MRESLNIERFKCFKSSSISLNNLTVLVGSNGNGKSSVVQALLLLRTACENKGGEIDLNGPYGLTLGTSSSVYNHESEGNNFTISISNAQGDKVNAYEFEIDQSEDSLQVLAKEITINHNAPIQSDTIYYLAAERMGPRISNALGNLSYIHTGVHGEYVAHVLGLKGGRIKVDENRMYPGSKDPNLETQTNHWIKTIFPNIRVSAIVNMDLLCAQVKIKNETNDSDYITAPNLGFGITYSLPVIVSGLIAKPNSYFIIENPEAHLHPAAQTAIGFFLAHMAYCGVKVVIETHSDHVINGIQLYVAKNPDWYNSVTINSFNVSEDGLEIDQISFDQDANISHWPRGFMDQSQRDFLELCRVRKSHV